MSLLFVVGSEEVPALVRVAVSEAPRSQSGGGTLKASEVEELDAVVLPLSPTTLVGGTKVEGSSSSVEDELSESTEEDRFASAARANGPLDEDGQNACPVGWLGGVGGALESRFRRALKIRKRAFLPSCTLGAKIERKKAWLEGPRRERVHRIPCRGTSWWGRSRPLKSIELSLEKFNVFGEHPKFAICERDKFGKIRKLVKHDGKSARVQRLLFAEGVGESH